MKAFSQLKKNLTKDFSALKPIKVALLGDTATQFLNIALRGTGYEYGYNLEIWEADFNQVERQVFDHESDFYAFKPEIVIIFQSSHKLLAKYNKLSPPLFNTLANTELNLISTLFSTINNRLTAKTIYFNYPEINDAVFGSHANKTNFSFPFQLRTLNYLLMNYAAETSGFYLCDLSAIQNQAGKAAVFQPSVYINAEMVLSIDILPEVGAKALDIVAAINGKFKKCLI